MTHGALLDRYQGALMGLACGDALGTTLEFTEPGTADPVLDIVGGGPWDLLPGQWTDDTSMALCLATSLVECRGFDAHDQMERYCRWKNEAYLSSTHRVVDIGSTVLKALERYEVTGNPEAGSTDPHSAGNGCTMRLAPIPMFYLEHHDLMLEMAAESSRLTHGAAECVAACQLFADQMRMALLAGSKEEVLHRVLPDPLPEALKPLADLGFANKTEAQLRPSGYVVECLEAALWCFYHTESYEEAVRRAANLGGDADTVAAHAGQLAGAFYGLHAIPERWRHLCARNTLILDLAEQLFHARYKPVFEH